MLPYMAQGANSAIEDGAVLGVLLSKITDLGPERAYLSNVLKLFEKVRKARSEEIAATSRRQVYMVPSELSHLRREVECPSSEDG